MTPPSEEQGTAERERRIVVGIDGSPGAARALEYAAHLAARSCSELHVVSAFSLLPTEGTWTAPTGLNEEAAAAAVTEGVNQAEALEPGLVVKGEHVFGTPGPVLVEISKNAGELVVGSRGLGHLRGLLLGSVSEFVAHHANCTTTVVR